MQNVPEHVRYMVERMATPLRDIRHNKISRLETKRYPLHEVVGTMISFLLYRSGNPQDLPEGIYIRTNRDISQVRKDPYLQRRIIAGALGKLKHPDHPDEPLEAHFHERASAVIQKAVFKIGPPEVEEPQIPTPTPETK